LPNFRHRGFSSAGNRLVAFVGCDAQQLLRKGSKVGFEVSPDATERAIKSLTDLIVQRHVSII
jgi:hypothetical protein